MMTLSKIQSMQTKKTMAETDDMPTECLEVIDETHLLVLGLLTTDALEKGLPA
jgi:hypothetical protein